MRKELTFIILTILLIVPALAQDLLQTDALTGKLEGQTENILEKEITIPSPLQIPFKLIFGIDSTFPITIERFTILLAAWIMFFTIIQSVLKISPFLNKGIQNIAGAVIVTSIIAMTGAMNNLTIFFFDLGDTFTWMESLGPFQLLLGLAISSLLIWVGHYIVHLIERKYILEKADYAGENIRSMRKMAKATSKNVDELAK